MLHLKWILPAAVAIALLSACGGGDGGASTDYVAGTELPAGVQRSVAELIAFTKLQIANTNEVRDPIVIGNATLATTETDEPADI